MINLPVAVFNKIKDKQNILISGMGGGFDVYGGLPLYYYLKKLGKNVVLANYSFTNHSHFTDEFELRNFGKFVTGTKGVFPDSAIKYFPEGYLARWLNQEKEIDTSVWFFPKVGPKHLREAYKKLIENMNIDFVFLVDGGVDSLMTGDEVGFGTILEDSISLAAFNSLEVESALVNVGFGTEIEEKVCHHHALENMSKIIRQGGFYGSCSLVNYMNSFQFYLEACEYVFNVPGHKKSHIHTRIIPAAQGEFGNYHMYEDQETVMAEKNAEVFISPLMSQMWFFNTRAVIYNNKVVPLIEPLNSFQEVVSEAMPRLKEWSTRERKSIPY